MQTQAPLTELPERTTCARCGTPFECGARSTTPCWCVALPSIEKVDASLKGCMCPACLTDALARQGHS